MFRTLGASGDLEDLSEEDLDAQVRDECEATECGW